MNPTYFYFWKLVFFDDRCQNLIWFDGDRKFRPSSNKIMPAMLDEVSAYGKRGFSSSWQKPGFPGNWFLNNSGNLNSFRELD